MKRTRVVDRVRREGGFQTDDYSCGPHALRHAMIALRRRGEKVPTVEEIGQHAGMTEFGAGSPGLRRVARRFGYRLQHERYSDPLGARRALSKILGQRIPVIIAIDHRQHWVTVLGRRDGRVEVCNSTYEKNERTRRPNPLVRIMTIDRLLWWWAVPMVTNLHRQIFIMYPVVRAELQW